MTFKRQINFKEEEFEPVINKSKGAGTKLRHDLFELNPLVPRKQNWYFILKNINKINRKYSQDKLFCIFMYATIYLFSSTISSQVCKRIIIITFEIKRPF